VTLVKQSNVNQLFPISTLAELTPNSFRPWEKRALSDLMARSSASLPDLSGSQSAEVRVGLRFAQVRRDSAGRALLRLLGFQIPRHRPMSRGAYSNLRKRSKAWQ